MDSPSIQMGMIVILFVFLSALFSILEASYSSLNRMNVKERATLSNKRAKLAYQISEKSDELHFTIMLAYTFSTVISGIATTLLMLRLFGKNGTLIATIVASLAIFIFGVFLPKILSTKMQESFAVFFAPLAYLLMILTTPINFLFGFIRSWIQKRSDIPDDPTMIEKELLSFVREAEDDGGINQEEGELIRNVIEFDDLTVDDILTPRVDIVSVQQDMSKEKIASLFQETGYSRLPVYDESIDYIIGIIHEKNFYRYVWNSDKNIDYIIKDVDFVPPTIKISSLLKRLQNSKIHMAVVVDEFGGTEGIVTMEDVIEELIGDIWDEHDEIEAESFKRDQNGDYIVYCSTDLDDLFYFFNLKEDVDTSSINGWIMLCLEKIPKPGDSFECCGLVFYIREVENNRVLSLSVTGDPLPETYYN